MQHLYFHKEIETFFNLLDLYYDIDYKTFRNVIIYQLLKDFAGFKQKNYQQSYENVSSKEISLRRGIIFLDDPYIFKIGISEEDGLIFNDDRFEEMVNTSEIDETIRDRGLSGLMISPPLTRGLQCVHFLDKRRTILRILSLKKNPLVYFLDRSSVQENKIIISYDDLEEYRPIQITDDPNAFFNNATNFSNVNKFLLASTIYPFILDDSVAEHELHSIEVSLEIENNEDFLVKGL